MDKIYLKQPVIVEGRYDKIKLQSFIGSLIIATDGFRIFKDREKRYMIRTLGKKYGLIILTDSDKGGLVIRNHLKSIAGGCKMTQLYIPQIIGKESRKAKPGKENLLGVEGMEISLLKNIFAANGLTEETADMPPKEQITKQDFYADGLSGRENSELRRKAFMEKLGVPSYLSANALLDVCNSLLSREEYQRMVSEMTGSMANPSE